MPTSQPPRQIYLEITDIYFIQKNKKSFNSPGQLKFLVKTKKLFRIVAVLSLKPNLVDGFGKKNKGYSDMVKNLSYYIIIVLLLYYYSIGVLIEN